MVESRKTSDCAVRRKDYSAAGSPEAAASTARSANHRFRNGFSANKAKSAEIESNTIAVLKTPDQPIFGSTIFAESGIGRSVTVRTRPYTMKAAATTNRRERAALEIGRRNTLGPRKVVKNTSDAPISSTTSARKSNALPVERAEPIGT